MLYKTTSLQPCDCNNLARAARTPLVSLQPRPRFQQQHPFPSISPSPSAREFQTPPPVSLRCPLSIKSPPLFTTMCRSPSRNGYVIKPRNIGSSDGSLHGQFTLSSPPTHSFSGRLRVSSSVPTCSKNPNVTGRGSRWACIRMATPTYSNLVFTDISSHQSSRSRPPADPFCARGLRSPGIDLILSSWEVKLDGIRCEAFCSCCFSHSAY